MATKKKNATATAAAQDVDTAVQVEPVPGDPGGVEVDTRPAEEVADTAGHPTAEVLSDDDVRVTHIGVTAFVEGFRRCGRAWSVQETIVSVDNFLGEEVEALLGDANLKVRLISRERRR